MNLDWMLLAACRGRTKEMFPAFDNDRGYYTNAKAICATCTVTTQCFDYAMQFPLVDMHGIWAGRSRDQLGYEQRKRGIKPVKASIAEYLQIFNHSPWSSK